MNLQVVRKDADNFKNYKFKATDFDILKFVINFVALMIINRKTMSNYQFDQIDQKILSFLVKNARMPFLEIARECNVSGAAIHQRVKRLEANGVITGSRLLVKPQALGLNVCAFVSVSLSEANKYPEVIESFKKISEVVECHFVTGKHNLLIKIYCFDHDHLMQILLNTIQKIPYVQQTETQISLDQAIERQVWVKEYQNTSFSESIKKHRKESI